MLKYFVIRDSDTVIFFSLMMRFSWCSGIYPSFCFCFSSFAFLRSKRRRWSSSRSSMIWEDFSRTTPYFPRPFLPPLPRSYCCSLKLNSWRERNFSMLSRASSIIRGDPFRIKWSIKFNASLSNLFNTTYLENDLPILGLGSQSLENSFLDHLVISTRYQKPSTHRILIVGSLSNIAQHRSRSTPVLIRKSLIQSLLQLRLLTNP